MPSAPLVIITSVISFKQKRLSYHTTRSAFSPTERVEQTKKTIKSVRERIPGAHIYLFECGLSDEMASSLQPLVDRYIYIGNSFWVRRAVDSIFKGLGEAVCLLKASTYFPRETVRFFKISGRYYLNENFTTRNFENKGLTVKRYGNAFSTRLYSFDATMLPVWKRALSMSLPFLLLNRSIESVLPLFIPKRYFVEVDPIGVAGFGGAHGVTDYQNE